MDETKLLPEKWKEPIIYHPVQERLVSESYRFKVVPAGRRSGKTFHSKREVVKAAMSEPGLYFCAAPTAPQAKKIFWKDIDALIPVWYRPKKPNLSDLIFYLANNSEIHIIGLDRPERFEGVPWTGGVIDEIANCKEDTWFEHVRPAFDTLFLETWCWLIGVPEGLNFYYDIYEYAVSSSDPEWMGYTWKSADILPARVIEAAKRHLSPKQYKQEYEAEFVTAAGRVYDDYSNDNHTDAYIDPDIRELVWTHDFNFTPMSSAIMQIKDGKVYAVDEIVLESAVAKQSAFEFVEKFKSYRGYKVKVYGDASGRTGEKHGHKSEYKQIEEILRRNDFIVENKALISNPAIKDSQNALRALILNASDERRFFVNPARCRYLDKGLKTLQLKKGSAFQEDDTSVYQHITTAARYFAHKEFPVIGAGGQSVIVGGV